MDSRGHIYNPEQVEALKAATDEASKKIVKTLVALDETTASELSALNHQQRRAWYSDYRRALKVAKKTGRHVKYPPIP